MQLVPLSADGRVTVAGCTVSTPGPLRIALEPDGGGVAVVALGPGVRRPAGRLGPVDAAAYGPLVRRLWAHSRVGTCPAHVVGDGALVLDLAPAPECLLANSPGDLVLLAAQRSVTVIREEHHQDVLAGCAGRVAVALVPRPIAAGKYAGRRGLEVTLDGRRVGELTRLMADRYLPMVDELAARGRRAGCEALLRARHRGVQVELRLPAVGASVPSAVAWEFPDPTVAIPWSRAAPTSTPFGPPPPTPAPTPAPLAQGPGERRRRVLWAGAAAVGVVLMATTLGHGTTTGTSSTAVTRSVAALPTPASTPTSTAPTSTAPASTATAVVPTRRTATRVTARPVPPTARTTMPPTRTVPPMPPTPPPRTTSPMPPPQPPPPPRCDPNYSGCVPIASDVDCEGGSGDGPAYVRGPVRVIGKDIYGLDKGGEPGIGCE